MCSDLASDFVAMWIYVGLGQKKYREWIAPTLGKT